MSDIRKLKQSTLEKYLKDNIRKEVIDHSLRASIDDNGNVEFYLHPTVCDGETLDFKVKGSQ